MQKYQRFWRSVVAALVVIVGLMVVAMTPLAQADSKNPNPQVLPPHSTNPANTLFTSVCT
jgi:hypothetical protein